VQRRENIRLRGRRHSVHHGCSPSDRHGILHAEHKDALLHFIVLFHFVPEDRHNGSHENILDAGASHFIRMGISRIMSKPLVSIVMGSDSDLEIMREAAKALEEFGIAYEIDVTSAHRSPNRTAEYARKAAGRGIRVIIAGAGGAAHLAGVIAAHTTLPVIGVPIPSTSLQGLDSLLATVQMPAGIPVATVAIGRPGATNAGILAAQMIGLGEGTIAKKLQAHKEKLAKSVEEKSKKLRASQE
jgi:5-(carboxyamino)imidazole ribonucleotide mutase